VDRGIPAPSQLATQEHRSHGSTRSPLLAPYIRLVIHSARTVCSMCAIGAQNGPFKMCSRPSRIPQFEVQSIKGGVL
jgi:hypothetical protein